MANIRLEEVNYDNFHDVLRLKLTRTQKDYVASNIFSLAEAYAARASKGYAMPFGIYRDDKPIGFLMLGYYPDRPYCEYVFGEDGFPEYIVGSYLIWRFMIDKRYQSRGYGRQALQLALDYIRTKPCGEAKYCWLSYEPENEVARELYRSFGFVEQEMPEGWDEVPVMMEL